MRNSLTIAVLALASQASAQQPVRVDQGYADVSPVMISQRKMELDQRLPSGFDGVYEFSKVNAFGRGQDMFMRIDGAVTAVFPKSVYIPTKFGMLPDIPPGTVFHIGPMEQTNEKDESAPNETFLDFAASPSAARTPRGIRGLRPDNYIDNSAASPPPVRSARREPVVGRASMITDEVYRQRRLAALLAHAAGE